LATVSLVFFWRRILLSRLSSSSVNLTMYFLEVGVMVDKPPQLVDRYTTEIVPELHTTSKISA
jgi:hypothetical protein